MKEEAMITDLYDDDLGTSEYIDYKKESLY